MAHNKFHETSGGGGGGGSSAETWTRYVAPDGPDGDSLTPGTLYSVGSRGGFQIENRPPTQSTPKPEPTPQVGPDANQDGFDDRTGLPLGAVRDPLSPTGISYQGKPINPNGSLWNEGDPLPAGMQNKDTITVTNHDGSQDVKDKATGKVLYRLREPGGQAGQQSSLPSRGSYPGGSGGGGGGGGSSGPVRDYPGEQASQNKWQMEYLKAQQDFQAAQSALNQGFQGDQAAQERAQQTYEKALDRLHSANQQLISIGAQYGMQQGQQNWQGGQNDANRLQSQNQFDAGLQSQQRSDALNRNMSNSQFAAKYGIDKAQVEMARQKLSLEAAALYSQQMQDFDPAAAIAFNEMGGGSIANAMAGGGDALSKDALHGASLTKRTMDRGWSPLADYSYEEEVVPPAYTPTPRPPTATSMPTPPSGTSPSSQNFGMPDWLIALINSPVPGAALPPRPPASNPSQGAPVTQTASGGFGTPAAAPNTVPMGEHPPATASPVGTPSYQPTYRGDGGTDGNQEEENYRRSMSDYGRAMSEYNMGIAAMEESGGGGGGGRMWDINPAAAPAGSSLGWAPSYDAYGNEIGSAPEWRAPPRTALSPRPLTYQFGSY